MFDIKKYCKGCGELLQNVDEKICGYTPKLDVDFCKSCFKNKNYGIVNNENNVFLNINSTLKNIKNSKTNVIMIIDILNPLETIVKNINNYIKGENVILVVNKRDIFPKSISDKKISNWIDKISIKANFSFNKKFIISSKKNSNIDNLLIYLNTFGNKNFAVIGFSNVGKSSFLKSLFASKRKNIENLVSNSLSTTRKEIKLELENLVFYDYPGFLLNSSYQNIVDHNELKIINPQTEVKVINYQLKDDQIVNLDKYANLIIKDLREKTSFQFMFSNLINISRHKVREELNENDYKKIELQISNSYKKYDLIISGLGIITLNKGIYNLILFLPENVKYNLIESLFN